MNARLLRPKPFRQGDGQTRPPSRPPCWKENARKWVLLITAVLGLIDKLYDIAGTVPL
jgi:hypothetical protein